MVRPRSKLGWLWLSPTMWESLQFHFAASIYGIAEHRFDDDGKVEIHFEQLATFFIEIFSVRFPLPRWRIWRSTEHTENH